MGWSRWAPLRVVEIDPRIAVSSSDRVDESLLGRTVGYMDGSGYEK